VRSVIARDLEQGLSAFASAFFEREQRVTVDDVDPKRSVLTFDPKLSPEEDTEFSIALARIVPGASFTPLAGATGDA
jgi:hypothetical protein